MTAVGQPGMQARLAAAAAAGTTNLKVTSTAGISTGDKIRLDIGQNTETVTVTSVGTSGASGTGLTLAAPLKFAHASNLPFSDRGTGITFSPATRFAHSSNEPVQALDSSITLNTPLNRSYAINAPVLDAAVTNAGYQGPPAPDQWFGGPALSSSAGSMVLRNAQGVVSDSLNYGGLVDPWLAEGYQGKSGTGQEGCFVAAPGTAAGAGTERGPLPGRRRHRQQLRRFHYFQQSHAWSGQPAVIRSVASGARCRRWAPEAMAAEQTATTTAVAGTGSL